MDFSNPFSRDSIRATALGPFDPQPPAAVPPLVDDPPLAQGLGFTPQEVQRQLEKVPGFSEALDRPEAETLRQYLHGGQGYDMSVLNRLVVDLTDAVAKAGRPGRGGEAAGGAPGSVPVHSVGVSPMLPADPDPGLSVRNTGPWWMTER